MSTFAEVVARLPESEGIPLGTHDRSIFANWVTDILDVIGSADTSDCMEGTVQGLAFLAAELFRVTEAFDEVGRKATKEAQA